MSVLDDECSNRSRSSRRSLPSRLALRDGRVDSEARELASTVGEPQGTNRKPRSSTSEALVEWPFHPTSVGSTVGDDGSRNRRSGSLNRAFIGGKGWKSRLASVRPAPVTDPRLAGREGRRASAPADFFLRRGADPRRTRDASGHRRGDEVAEQRTPGDVLKMAQDSGDEIGE